MPTTAINTGLSLSGTALATMTKLPERTPALPSPATARPMMSVMELFAIPQRSEPNRKTIMATRNAVLTEKSQNTRPNTGWNAHAVSRYVAPYQPMSGVDLNSCVTYGVACLYASVSHCGNREREADSPSK